MAKKYKMGPGTTHKYFPNLKLILECNIYFQQSIPKHKFKKILNPILNDKQVNTLTYDQY